MEHQERIDRLMPIKPKGLSDILREDPSLEIPITYEEFKNSECSSNISNEHSLSEAYKEFCRVKDELKDMKYINYVQLHNPIPWRVSYVYLDVKSCDADHIFVENKIPIRFKGDYHKSDYPFIIVLCNFSKKYVDRFIASMEKLNNVLLIKGYKEYPDACLALQRLIKEGILWK